MSSTTPSKHDLPKLDPHKEVYRIGQRTRDLAMFWRREDGDALGVLAGLLLLKRPVLVRHVDAAVQVLLTYQEPDAIAFARRLERLTLDWSFSKPAWHTHTDSVYLRKKLPNYEYQCVYFIEPTTKLQCSRPGTYVVSGARGTFCATHARHTIQRVARKRARQSRKTTKAPTAT